MGLWSTIKVDIGWCCIAICTGIGVLVLGHEKPFLLAKRFFFVIFLLNPKRMNMKIIFILVSLVFSTLAGAMPLNKLVVFGDSLSDNGNLYEYMKHELPMSPPYYKGRFTNGPVWVELLMDEYYSQDAQTHLLDYAFGGAGVAEEDDTDPDDVLFTLNREIDSYLLSHNDKADDQSMYVVWMGANNYLAVPENADETVETVTSGIKHELERLVEKGAKHIMVVSVPNLGRIPAAKDFDAVPLLTELSTKHNAKLKEMISEFEVSTPSVQWLYFDINNVMNELLDFPERYGLTNITDTCYEEMVNEPSDESILKMVSRVKAHAKAPHNACSGYLFFDPVHPSETAHLLMVEQTKKMFDEKGITFE